jgi:hypothetical protein
MDLIIYLLINGLLIALIVLAAKFWSVLGAFGGLIGAILSYLALTSTSIEYNSTYDATQAIWVYQSMPMEFFAYVPVLLTFLCIVVVFKGK